MKAIEFDETLTLRTIDFCKRELEEQIYDSLSNDRYLGLYDRICAKIEILYRLGEKESANKYARDYNKVLGERIVAENEINLKVIRLSFQKFCNSLSIKYTEEGVALGA